MKFPSFNFIGERRLAFAMSKNNPEALPQLETPEQRKENPESLDPKKKAGELQGRATEQMDAFKNRIKRTETEADKLRKLANTDDIVTEAKDATVIGLLTPDAHTKPSTEIAELQTASVDVSAGDRAKAGENKKEEEKKLIKPESVEKQGGQQSGRIG